MAQLDIHKCPETGICSILKPDGSKIDLVPSEADQLKQAAADSVKLKAVLQEVDTAFAESLNPEDLNQIAGEFK